MRRVLAVGVIGLALVGCTPVVSAPIGRGGDRICEWVREAVRAGSMTLEMAFAWYAQCGPFEVPR